MLDASRDACSFYYRTGMYSITIVMYSHVLYQWNNDYYVLISSYTAIVSLEMSVLSLASYEYIVYVYLIFTEN
jgi:hypothetical protein